MREVAALHSGQRVAFLVCSNEPVATLLSLEGLKVFEGPGTAIGDLYALAGCDKLMAPRAPSRFGLLIGGGAPVQMLQSTEDHVWEGGFVIHENV
jgi:hypothetical protein